ncbi:hypothetical protein BKA70DRAFT_1423353 [Coprinopsis sp. MPI-PUGE-AT-0042]|nr:hypothetical protein BKA70DRAFT_1423353 [Coprinopsis sp. MPI-PUGE-AT-0042]
MAIHPTAAITFFNNVYLLTLLLANADWVLLALIRQVSRTCRLASQDAMQERIQKALVWFIPGHRIREFFDVVDRRGGLVAGSAARYPVVIGRSFHVPAPNNLNIIVPPNEAEDMMNDLADFNYQCWRNDTILRPLRSVYQGHFWMGYFQGQPYNPCITVVEASFTTLKSALASVWTHQMNIITVQRVYSFYPRWTLENVSLQGVL